MTEARGSTATLERVPAGLELLPRREVVVSGIDLWFPLAPGDRAAVQEGQLVATGTRLAERLRDPRTLLTAGPPRRDGAAAPGDPWRDTTSRGTSRDDTPLDGELLFRSGDRWRVAAGERTEILESPASGTVTSVSPSGIILHAPARAILGTASLAGPTAGPLLAAAPANGELRAQHVDVGAAGSIIVAGARIDAEALTRARAVGVRGVVVGALGIKEQRDFLASERRGRAAVHGLPSFGVLVLDGAARRPIAGPVMAILEALEGATVAIVPDPPALLIEDAGLQLPEPPPDLVRVRSGPLVGAEGRWGGLAGPRRFPAGVTLEAGLIRLGDRQPVAVPLGDLERFA